MRAFYAVLLLALPLTSALRTFTTNCTIPNITSDFYYVSSPNVRGSFQIIWTSISTLIICSYSVLHLNVPEQRRGKNPGFWGDLKWRWSHALVDLRWSIIAVLVPEFILAKSMDDFLGARKALKKLKSRSPLAACSWTLTHMFFANMGGFVLETTTTASDATAKTGTMTGTVMDATAALVENERLGSEKTELLPLSAMDIVAVIISDIGDLADMFPIEAPITEEELQDRSKSDAFTKSLAMFQITYFFIDFFSRIAQKLPITQLELTVVGIAVYSLLAYGFFFGKPKAANTTVTIKKFSGPNGGIPAKLSAVLAREPTYSSDFPSRTWKATAPDNSEIEDWMLLLVGLLGVPLGAIHLTGWNLSFPTWIDAWLWRASAIVVTAVGPAMIFFCFICATLFFQTFEYRSLPVLYAMVALYVVGRLILLVETVRCLFFLPPRAFLTTSWTGGLPHFG